MACHSVSMPRAGPWGQAGCLSQAPRAVDYWSCGSKLTAEDVASFWSAKPEALTLKHKRYSVLYVCIAVRMYMCPCVSGRV